MLLAEQIWDWRVRGLFALVCAIAVIAAIVAYLALGRGERQDGRARRCFGRIAVALDVVAVAEMGFFKDALSALLLVVTALAIGLLGLRLPAAREDGIHMTPDPTEGAADDFKAR